MAKENFDTVVVGGGASGMMAAIVAAGRGKKVALLEKNASLGKKLLLTGNGRCNITHANHTAKEFVEKLGKDGRFIHPSFAVFGAEEVMRFFEDLGLELMAEESGRVFPASGSAQDVLRSLTEALKRNKVKIFYNSNFEGFELKDEKIERLKTSRNDYYAENFILAVGGSSYPSTGSTGDGYRWLEKIGHKIIPPVPALVPVKVEEEWVRSLSGLSLKGSALYIVSGKKKEKLGSGEIIFTHFGLSGPAIITASKVIGERLKDGPVRLNIDLFPALNINVLEAQFKQGCEKNKKRNLKNFLADLLPEKLAAAVIKIAGFPADAKVYSLGRSERNGLARLCKNMPVKVIGLLGFPFAFITAGGVDLKEVDPKTMRSKKIRNLFLAGEVLNLDGPTGGYNLQIAWTTGHAAGMSVR